MNSHAGIHATLARKSGLAAATPPRFLRVRQAAENLSRRNADGAIVELFAEAVQRLTLLAYETDGNGFCNIDGVTGRSLVPLPWGRAGHRRWGIRPSECIILREMMQLRQVAMEGRPPGLWQYNKAGRQWQLNLFDFDRLEDGQRYWQRWPLTVTEYRAARAIRLGDRVATAVVGQ